MIKATTPTAGAFIVGVLAFVFFICSLSNNFSASHDSINYLNHIVRGDHLFHQHHLLYHFVANGWLRLWSAVFTGVPPHYIVESFTAVWGSATLAVCHLFFRKRFHLTPLFSFLCLLPVVFSFGLWFYSVNVEVYAPPLFFVLTSLFIMSRRNTTSSDVLVVALLQSMAVLFHQMNVLFTPVVIWWMFAKRHQIPFFATAARYIAVCLVVAGGVYLYVGWVVEHNNSIARFTAWVLGYTVGHDYWQPFDSGTPVRALTGFARAFVGGHFVFQVPPVQRMLPDAISSHRLQDEIFLAGALPGAMAWILLTLTGLFFLVLAVMAVRYIISYRRLREHGTTMSLLLCTLLFYSVFFLFWEPEVLEFWILQMIVVWLLLLGTLPLVRFPLRVPAAAGVVLIAACLAVVNYAGSMKWLSKAEYDWYRQEVRQIEPQPGDLVIVEEEWILKDYVRYFTPARVIATDEKTHTREEIANEVRSAVQQNAKVYRYSGRWEVILSY